MVHCIALVIGTYSCNTYLACLAMEYAMRNIFGLINSNVGDLGTQSNCIFVECEDYVEVEGMRR